MVSQFPAKLMSVQSLEPSRPSRARRSLAALTAEGSAEATLKAAKAVRTEMSCMMSGWMRRLMSCGFVVGV